MFKNMGGNIPGGNFPEENSPGGNLMGGNFQGGSFTGGVFLIHLQLRMWIMILNKKSLKLIAKGGRLIK